MIEIISIERLMKSGTILHYSGLSDDLSSISGEARTTNKKWSGYEVNQSATTNNTKINLIQNWDRGIRGEAPYIWGKGINH